MLKRRIEALEGELERKRAAGPRHVWWLLWRELRDPFAARDELLERQREGPLSAEDAAELTRLEAAIPRYQDDMNI